MKLHFLSIALAFLFIASSSKSQSWSNSFFPAQYDVNGKYLGGTEVMSLTPHKGKLYAATSYVCDLNSNALSLSGGTPILVLDSANANWKQDVLFIENQLIPSLKEIIFTKDFQGNNIQPDTLLITGPNNKNDHIFIYIKDDLSGNWITDSVTTVSGNVETRSIGTHYDAVTGHQFIFIGVSDFGIWKGEYNPSLPQKIQWNPVPELTISTKTRVPAIVDVNGVMYLSTTETTTWTSIIFRRKDGFEASYDTVFKGIAPDGLDLRGLTQVKNPDGDGYDLWFYWNDYFRRLEPQHNDTIINEMQVSTDLTAESGRMFSGIITAAYNDHQLYWKDPITNDSVMLIGFQAMYDSTWLSQNPYPNIAGRSIDGMYFSRKQDNTTIIYQLHYIVNNSPQVIDTLLAVRTICISPFASDSNKVLYSGGYHTNYVWLNNTAWVYKGNFESIATDVNEELKNKPEVFVYPNPASNSFVIDLREKNATIRITDLSGGKIFERKNFYGKETIDCKNFSGGVYLIHIITDEQLTFYQKIIILKY